MDVPSAEIVSGLICDVVVMSVIDLIDLQNSLGL